MAAEPGAEHFDVDGLSITALTKGRPAAGSPLVVALHGGTYTARYFDVDGSGRGSFMDLAAANGYQVLSIDRPGYGGSTPLVPAQNTFDRHAHLLRAVIAQAAGDRPVFLVGHSIGGMIALMIAGRRDGPRLIGLSVTGMGAVIRRGGAAEALASLPPDETIDLPYDQRDLVMFGPAGTYTPEGLTQAHGSYAPTPVRELIAAPRWADEILPGVAPAIEIPVHNALAEYDALWDSTADNVAHFAKLLTNAPFVEASLLRGPRHTKDPHTLGHALHLRQLAFAEECIVWERQAPGR